MPFLPMRVSALALGLALFAAPCLAQQPSAGQQAATQATPGQIAAAKDLINFTGALTTVDDMIPAFGEQIKRQTLTRPEIQKDLDEVLKQIQPELQQQREQILNKAAADYAKYMSEQEMRDVLAFFKTQAGSKYIKAQPALIDDLVSDVSAWSDQMSEYVVTRVRAEMLKRGHQMQ
jgi:hypothetical protein